MRNFLGAPEPPLTVAEGLFGLLSFGDVTQDREPAAYPLDFEDLHGHADLPNFARLPAELDFHIMQKALFLQTGQDLRPVGRVDINTESKGGLSNDFFGLVAK